MNELQEIEDFIASDSIQKNSKKDFHIVLISLYSFNPFGIYAIGNVLRSHGFRVSYIFFKNYFSDRMNLPAEAEYKEILDLVKKLKPNIVGVGAASTFAPVAFDLISSIRTLDIPVIMGGAHAIYNPEHCIKHADFVCIGEGEVAMLKLAYALFTGGHCHSIKNLWIKENDRIIRNDLYPLIQNLDIIPLPDFSSEDKYFIENGKLYIGEAYYKKNTGWYIFMSGRGCPFSCSFCSNSYLKNHYKGKGPLLRSRSVNNVIEELKNAKSVFPRLSFVASNDEIFGLNKEWLVDFVEKYKKDIKIPFHCDIHPSKVTDEMIALLKGMGLRTITMGVQSGSELIRREVFNRNTPNTMIIKCAYIFKKYNVFPHFDFILDNPLGSSEEIMETLKLLSDLPRPFVVNTYALQYLPNTNLTLLLLSKGIIKETDIEGYDTKGFKEFHVVVNRENNQDSLFAYKVCKMYSYFFPIVTRHLNFRLAVFPKWVIGFIVKRNYFFKRRPFILDGLCVLGKSFEKFGKGLSLLLDWNISKLYERIFLQP